MFFHVAYFNRYIVLVHILINKVILLSFQYIKFTQLNVNYMETLLQITVKPPLCFKSFKSRKKNFCKYLIILKIKSPSQNFLYISIFSRKKNL